MIASMSVGDVMITGVTKRRSAPERRSAPGCDKTQVSARAITNRLRPTFFLVDYRIWREAPRSRLHSCQARIATIDHQPSPADFLFLFLRPVLDRPLPSLANPFNRLSATRRRPIFCHLVHYRSTKLFLFTPREELLVPPRGMEF